MQTAHTLQPRGFASVLALILLATFASLATVFACGANMNLKTVTNQVEGNQTRLEAESGMAYLSYVLQQTSLPAGATWQDALDDLAAALQSSLNGTANVDGQEVSYSGSVISVPQIETGNGNGFTATLSLNVDDTIRLRVTGYGAGSTYQAQMDFSVSAARSGALDYGVASRGKITMVGNAKILGANEPAEGNVLSATYSDLEAVSLTGNCCLAGDLFIANPDAHVSLTGNVTIGGESQWSGDIEDHVHIGVGDVTFPEADPSIFEPFATNIVDASTPTSGNRAFSNIRILANTNPTFAGNITLKGVVFIETPNRVKFSGNLHLTGVVVTQDAGDDNLSSNYIKFSGNTSTLGVESLPDLPEYAARRELPGTFLVAPGFSTQFTGNFGTVNGAMAADEFKFTGNAGGVVHGPIINWGDTEFKLTGNANLTIDRDGSPGLPAGFMGSSMPVALPETYQEVW